MVKKSDHPPVIDEPRSSGERALARDRERPLVEGRHIAHDDSDLEVRGRRYRIGVHDGFVGIWELRSGEQVGTFMEDAFSAAWARYLELEQSRSINRFMLRTREFVAHRWYAIVVVVLGALTVAYLRTEDPALSPTGPSVRVQEARVVRPIADLGSTLAGTLDPSLAVPPSSLHSAEEGHGREQQKKDRGAGKNGPAGGGATAAPSSPSGGASGSGTSGGSSSGDTGGSTGSDGGGAGGGTEPPPEPEDPPTSAQPPPPPDS